MHYFLLPIVPLTIAGAIFFKKRFAAYGCAVVLTLIKMLMTRASLVYFFMGLGLLALVFIARKINNPERISLVRVAITAAVGVFVYALASNFGVWVGACTPGERLYALNFVGFLECYKAALPYAGVHFLKAIPSTLVLVQALQWMKRWNVSLNLQRLISNKV